MTTLYLDTETYSEEPIKNGTFRYAEHPSAQVMLATWAFDDGPVEIAEFPSGDFIQSLVDEADEIVVHNSFFDRTVLRIMLGVDIPIEKITDTMVQAMAHSLPGGLGPLCDILGVEKDKAKDKAGKQYIQLFCKPRPKNTKIRRATSTTHPIEWQRFREYAMSDIPSMRELHRKLPRWNYPDNAREKALWVLDQKINDRGIAVDTELAEGAVAAIGRAKVRLDARTKAATGGEVSSATRRDAMLRHLLEWYGVALVDFQKGTLERCLDDEEIPEPVKELLRLRLMTASTSTAKYNALLRSTAADGRLHGLLQYCGAGRTGRWSGRLFQPQNLPRTMKKWKKWIGHLIEHFKAGSIDLAFDDDEVMEAAVNVIRGALVAKPGHKLIASDLSNIEGRMLAWLAGEEWKLKAFARGEDLYILGYSRSFGIPVADVEADEKAGGMMRLIGKVQELALGYQGAVGAFQQMAQGYGVNLSEERVDEIVKGWRSANSKIVEFWYDLEDAALRAVQSSGTRIECGKLVLRRDGSWLRIRLPSGRFLCYPGVKVQKAKCWPCKGSGRKHGARECGDCGGTGVSDRDQLTYMGIDQYTRRWKRLETYGGKLVENVTQAASRDILAHNMADVDKAGYSICLSVHDEIVCETPDRGGFTSPHLSAMLSTNPFWAVGLPLAAEGWEDGRYRK